MLPESDSPPGGGLFSVSLSYASERQGMSARIRKVRSV